MAHERLRPEDRLRRTQEYRRCYRQGRRRHGKLLSLHHVSNELRRPRFGMTASRRVGGAVVRNRLKRRIREIVRRWPRRQELESRDIVVHLKPEAAEATWAALKEELERLLSGLIRRPPGR